MPEVVPPAQELPDLTSVADPDVRRALRAMQAQISTILERQQREIDALLEMMMEHHMGSISEFKRHFVRLQQNVARGARIHDAIFAAPAAPRVPAPMPGAR
jgi:hypothetical protein